MRHTGVIVAILAIALAAFAMYYAKRTFGRRETWYSYNREVGKIENELWRDVYTMGEKNIQKIDMAIRKKYPYRGTGSFIGMVCRKPNEGCTTYANYM